MSKAHSGSILPIKNGVIIPIDYEDTLFPFYWNKVSGRGHEPVEDVSTIVRADKFEYAVAIEEETENVIKNGSFETGDLTSWGVWTAYGNTSIPTVVDGEISKKMAILEASPYGTTSFNQSVGKLSSGETYTFSGWYKFFDLIPSYSGFYYTNSYSSYSKGSTDSDGGTSSILTCSTADFIANNVEVGFKVQCPSGTDVGTVQEIISATQIKVSGTVPVGSHESIQIIHKDNDAYHNPSAGVDGSKLGKWQKLEHTFTAPSHPWYNHTSLRIRGHHESAHFKFYVCMLQLEKKNFSTSYTSSARSIGRLTYDKSLFNPKEFTINLWVNINRLGTGTAHNTLFEIANAYAPPNRILLYAEGGEYRVLTTAELSSTQSVIYSGYPPKSKEWQMVSVTFDGSVLRLYADGDLIGAKNAVAPTFTKDAMMAVGGRVFNPLNGSVSNLMISPRAWSDGEIKAMHYYDKPLYDPYNCYSIYGE